nr:hypothetical protein [uncultured Pseudodesulfovibrio sp.]
MRLNVLAEILDTHAIELLTALRSMGVRLSLVLPEPTQAEITKDLFDSVVREAPSAGAFLCIPTPSLLRHETPISSMNSWNDILSQVPEPIILDAARLPLSGRGDILAKQWIELLPVVSGLIVRDEIQSDKLHGYSSRQTLQVPEYLRQSCVPRHVAADINWLLFSVIQQIPVPQLPPSRYTDAILRAPANDVEATNLAQSVLDIDPLSYPALLRLYRINKSKSEWTAHALLHAARKMDRFNWLHEIIAEGNSLHTVLDREFFGDHRSYSLGGGTRKKKRILLFVVYKQRDLFIDLLLMHHLEALGHEVFLRPLNITSCNSLLELRPDLVIWGARTTRIQRSLSRFAADRGILQVVRREEGLIYGPTWKDRTPEIKSLTLGTEDYSPYVDLEIGYNGDFRRTISSEGYMPLQRLISVGAMSFDIYHHPCLKALLPNKNDVFERLGLDQKKKLLIMASSWSYADRDLDNAIPEAGTAKGELLSHSRETVINARKGRDAWFDFMSRFCAEHEDEWNVLLKVHPGERIDAYDRFIEENALPVKTLCDGYMIETLRHCDMLMHTGSTTAVEAHLIGIPSFAYWVPSDFKHPLYDVATIVNSYEEFQHFFEVTPLGQSTMTPEDLTFLQDTFWGSIDGYACQRAANAIDSLLATSTNTPYRFPTDTWKRHEDLEQDEMGLYLTIQETDKYTNLIKSVVSG